jgi:hypothetical protein
VLDLPVLVLSPSVPFGMIIEWRRMVIEGRGMVIEWRGMVIEWRGMVFEGRGMVFGGRGMLIEGAGIIIEGRVASWRCAEPCRSFRALAKGGEKFEAGSKGESCGHPPNRDDSGLPLLCVVHVETE